MKPAQILIRYARGQRTAFKEMGFFDLKREKAVKEILRVSAFFIKSDRRGWVTQIEDEIRELLPSEDNEKKKELREQILQLLNN
jgi:NCAIR mutase (PurE)-related protein